MSSFLFLRQLVERRLEGAALAWYRRSADEIADGVANARFCALLSAASRHARRTPLAAGREELDAAERTVEGLNPERWTLLETVRIALVLSRGDLKDEAGALAVEDAFRYADEGELVALYRTLALLPDPERFAWRAGEGCRSNMRSVFEAAALDTPFPVRFFDELAWNQAVIKCVFVEAPLWRMWGLDTRLSPELARMALDLVDERRSAGREVQPELWSCLGEHGGKRALRSIEAELDPGNASRAGRSAAACALARAGQGRKLKKLLQKEGDPEVARVMRAALEARPTSADYRPFSPDPR